MNNFFFLVMESLNIGVGECWIFFSISRSELLYRIIANSTLYLHLSLSIHPESEIMIITAIVNGRNGLTRQRPE